jgi:RHS repeat-associated protein
VQRVTGGVTTQYVYDAQGQLAAEFSSQAPTVTGTEYLIADHLGSTRMSTNSSGGCLQLHDYLPFGEDTINTLGGRTGCYGTSDGVAEKFTGKERDSETNLDFFGARYFSGAQGRWTSVDPSMESAILELPQTWNRYSYVYNRPTFATDPDGRCPPCVGAIVGGIVEGGWNLGSQLYSNGGHLGDVRWGEVGANTLGGAVAGGLAVATGGGSLLGSAVLGDAVAGAGATVVGGIVTRTAEGQGADEVLSPGNVTTDALSGFVGGGVGHLAADVIHVPEDPALPGSRRHAVGRRNLAKYDAAVAARNSAVRLQTGLGVAAGSPPMHGVAWFADNVFSVLDWLVFSSPPPQSQQPNLNTSRIVSCTDMKGNPCTP